MKMSPSRRYGLAAAALVVSLSAVFGFTASEAQRRGRPVQEPVAPAQRPAPAAPPTATEAVAPEARKQPEPQETVQADVSTRSVAVTSGFTGVEIVVFGAVDNSRQASAESGFYDVVVVIEGTPSRIVARRKSNIAGIWINTQAVTFESVPSYYAIATTRPLDEIADPIALRENDIGFEQVRMAAVRGWETGLSTADLEDFRSAVIRLKRKDELYVQAEYGVAFIGRSLFRASIDLPANIPVGPLLTRVHLFRGGQLLSTYSARVNLQREGLEHLLHSFAFRTPVLYGLFTVALAVGAGLIASTVFRRGAR